jgi:hypothetical protein
LSEGKILKLKINFKNQERVMINTSQCTCCPSAQLDHCRGLLLKAVLDVRTSAHLQFDAVFLLDESCPTAARLQRKKSILSCSGRLSMMVRWMLSS